MCAASMFIKHVAGYVSRILTGSTSAPRDGMSSAPSTARAATAHGCNPALSAEVTSFSLNTNPAGSEKHHSAEQSYRAVTIQYAS